MALAAVACSSSPTPTAHQIPQVLPLNQGPSQDQPAVDTTPTGGRGLPVTVDIPAIGVHATHLVALGLNKDGSPSTPPTNTPQVLGYYGLGGAPCQPGASKVPFVLIGHIDGNHQNGVFYQLKNLKAGAVITVGLDNGTSCTYHTSKLAEYKKQDLACATDLTKRGAECDAARRQQNAEEAKQIWGPVTSGEIRLISCGGPFVGPPLFYQDNLVGMGTLVS